MAVEQKEQIKKAGDVVIEEVIIIGSTGTRFDVTLQLISIELFEDLFAPTISGNITITDSLDLVNNVPFVGEEVLQLRFRTPQYTEDRDIVNAQFYIYKMTNRELLGDKNAVYTLHFTSLETLSDSNIALTKPYTGKISNIVEQLTVKEGLTTNKNVIIEDTKNSVKYVSNYWSPFKNLNYLTKRAMNAKGASNFVFFENRLGFNFASLDTLMNLDYDQYYTLDKFDREFKGIQGSNANPEEEYSRIKTLYIETGFDYLRRINSGMYSSKLISHDLITKKYAVQTYDYFDDFDKFNHLNPYPLSTKQLISRTNSKIITHGKHHALFNGTGSDGSNEWLLRRLSLMNQADSFKVHISVPGRTNMTVGRTVFLLLYRVEQRGQNENPGDLIDQMYSGKYLITSINHDVTRSEHTMHLELMKESLILDLEGTK